MHSCSLSELTYSLLLWSFMEYGCYICSEFHRFNNSFGVEHFSFIVIEQGDICGHDRASGNELLKSGRFTEACSAYWEGLQYSTAPELLAVIILSNRRNLWTTAIKLSFFIRITLKLYAEKLRQMAKNWKMAIACEKRTRSVVYNTKWQEVMIRLQDS